MFQTFPLLCLEIKLKQLKEMRNFNYNPIFHYSFFFMFVLYYFYLFCTSIIFMFMQHAILSMESNISVKLPIIALIAIISP